MKFGKWVSRFSLVVSRVESVYSLRVINLSAKLVFSETLKMSMSMEIFFDFFFFFWGRDCVHFESEQF